MIYFHPTYILVSIIYILCGYYLNLIVFTSLVLVHEMGHYISSKIFKFKVEKIIIYPYGGITKLDGFINKDINKELIVSISGILLQIIFFYIIINMPLRSYTINLYKSYNREIIIFNILPIYPLDGYRIVNLLLNKIYNYDLSNKISIFISIVVIMILFKYNYSNTLAIFILIYYLYTYIKSINYLYNKFLLERYIYNIKFGKTKIINNKKLYKNRYHIIKINNKYLKEEDYLKKYFK